MIEKTSVKLTFKISIACKIYWVRLSREIPINIIRLITIRSDKVRPQNSRAELKKGSRRTPRAPMSYGALPVCRTVAARPLRPHFSPTFRRAFGDVRAECYYYFLFVCNSTPVIKLYTLAGGK